MATVVARKPRIPLAAMDAAKSQIYRDPVKRAPRPRRAAAAAAGSAIQAVLTGDSKANRPMRILRSTSASNIPQAKPAAEKPAAEEPKPAQVAGRKRRANSVELARAVRARTSADVSVAVRTSSARSDTTAFAEETAWTESQSCSGQSHSDSQATAVEEGARAEAVTRKIAKPSRAFSSMRSLAGPAVFDLPAKNNTEQVQDWDDIDADDADDPLMVSEYISDIIEYMRKLEKKTMP
ncbi:G2/mitotic-specific cyclin, partial [Coemansia brasiliensis]